MENKRKIIVLDDDPTGTQTVHDVCVYTDWSEETFDRIYGSDDEMSFVLTNSRSFSREKTVSVHREIGRLIRRMDDRYGVTSCIISRGDSTLRGHFPYETEALAEGTGYAFDGEVIMPFFPESGRYTVNNIHYVAAGDKLIPAGETEFAHDATFGYQASALDMWVEEKTGGQFPASSCICIPAGAEPGTIADLLRSADGFRKIIVNAETYDHVRAFTEALEQVTAEGKRFLFRTAAAFPKVLGHIPDIPLLGQEEICDSNSKNGGLIIIGSHVRKTTGQLQALRDMLPDLAYMEFDVSSAADPAALDDMARSILRSAEDAVSSGRTVVVYTSRRLIRPENASPEDQLRFSVGISDALTSVPARITSRPRYLIAKGGITSSDVATRALGIRRARVLGQAAPGVPVWQAGEETRFPGLSYVIFPGNVGQENTLAKIAAGLEQT